MNLPPISIPPGTRIAFVGVFNPKKSGKTTVVRIVANEFSDAGFELVLLRHDKHSLLDCYGESHQIELAKASQVIKGKALQDLKNHAVFNDVLMSLPDNPRRVVLLDGSGPGSERIGAILKAGRFNATLASNNVYALFLVPFRPITDSAQAAVAMIEELHLVMPGHYVVPVPIFDPEDVELLPKDHPFFAAIKLARHGVIRLPSLGEEIARGLERLERPLTELGDPDSEDALRYIAKASGQDRLIAGMIAEGIQELVMQFEDAVGPLSLVPGE